MVFVATQPLISVPLTEYVVLTVGLTLMLGVFKPVLQVYVFTPLAVNTELNPTHTEALELLKLIVGLANKTTVCVLVLTQPNVSVPVTVYVVVILGVTEILATVGPVFQV